MPERKLFLLTMQRNETLLLPYFLKHYARYFLPRHVHIIDHGSIPGLVPPEYNTIFVPSDRPFSERARLKLITGLASGLLEYYDAGIYVDCDELICLDRLNDIDFANSPIIHVAGFDVFRADTPDGKRILGMLNKDECKPLIFSRTPNWTIGFHRCDDVPKGPLTVPMAHIRYFFMEQSSQRLVERLSIYDSMHAGEKNVGVDFQWSKGDSVMKTFYRDLNRFDKQHAIPFTEIDPFNIASLSNRLYDLSASFPSLLD